MQKKYKSGKNEFITQKKCVCHVVQLYLICRLSVQVDQCHAPAFFVLTCFHTCTAAHNRIIKCVETNIRHIDQQSMQDPVAQICSTAHSASGSMMNSPFLFGYHRRHREQLKWMNAELLLCLNRKHFIRGVENTLKDIGLQFRDAFIKTVFTARCKVLVSLKHSKARLNFA